MNNSIGRARVEQLGERLALGTDGIGSDMFEESHAAYFRLREDDLDAPCDWPLARLAAVVPSRRPASSTSRCSARSRRARLPTSSCSTTRRRPR